MTLQPILKTFYDSLRDDGKILGLKCKECGAIQFPPVPVCNTCGCMDTEWTEMSGDGELVSFAFNPLGMAPYKSELTMIGYVRLKEGMLFASQLLNVTEDQQPELLRRMSSGETIPIKLEIHPLDDTVSFPMIRLV